MSPIHDIVSHASHLKEVMIWGGVGRGFVGR
jgi:hypothetical protein